MTLFNIFLVLVGVIIVCTVKVDFGRFKKDTIKRTFVNEDSKEEWNKVFSQFSVIEFWLNCFFYLMAFIGGLVFISASFYWLFPVGFILAIYESAIRFAVALLLILLIRTIYTKAWRKFPKVARFDAEMFEVFLKEKNYAVPRKIMVRVAYILIAYSFISFLFLVGRLVVILISGGA